MARPTSQICSDRKRECDDKAKNDYDQRRLDIEAKRREELLKGVGTAGATGAIGIGLIKWLGWTGYGAVVGGGFVAIGIGIAWGSVNGANSARDEEMQIAKDVLRNDLSACATSESQCLLDASSD